MNNKPFWQDKTCKEMAGLHVKVTFNSGTIVTGVTNMNECVRRRNGYQSRRAKARRVAARVLLNKWLDKQMEVDDELA